MVNVIEDRELLEIQSLMPAGRRVLFLLFSLVPLAAPYQLLIRVNWNGYVNAFFAFAMAVSLGAVAVTALLVWAAVAGLSSRLEFDRKRGTVTYSTGAPVVRWRTVVAPLEDISHLEVAVHDWSDGPPSYSFAVHFADGQAFTTGSFSSRDEVEDVKQLVSTLLAR